MYAQVCEYTKTYYIVYFKRASFMIYKLYHNKKIKNLKGRSL